MNKQYRLQLISPIIGEKIYQSNSFKKGIQKCYEEFKASGNDSNEFSVMDTITYKTFKFAVNKNKKNNNNKDNKGYNNGNNKYNNIKNNDFLDLDENIINNKNDNPEIENKINDLENTVNNLKNQIKSLESKIYLINKSKIENDNNSGCIIM